MISSKYLSEQELPLIQVKKWDARRAQLCKNGRTTGENKSTKNTTKIGKKHKKRKKSAVKGGPRGA